MQLMMIAYNQQQGQLEIADGPFIPKNKSCLSRWDILPILNPAAPSVSKAAAPSPKTAMVTPMSLPTPKQLLYGTPSDQDVILLVSIDVTTPKGAVLWSHVPELVSLELMLHLYYIKDLNVSQVMNELAYHQVPITLSFNIKRLTSTSKRSLHNASVNVSEARRCLVRCLNGCFVPKDSDLLQQWYNDSKQYSSRDSFNATNTQLDPQRGVQTLSMEAIYILRHIMHSHKITVSNVLSLWASFYTSIMQKPLAVERFISQMSLWNNVQRLHYIDQALATINFVPFISTRTSNGFQGCFYSLSNDSEHYSRNRHVLIISSNNSTSISILEPSFRHVTSSVNEVKSNNSSKNADAIIAMLGLRVAVYYGGGTNDNASNAQKEI
jgi:hypothetical protein